MMGALLIERSSLGAPGEAPSLFYWAFAKVERLPWNDSVARTAGAKTKMSFVELVNFKAVPVWNFFSIFKNH